MAELKRAEVTGQLRALGVEEGGVLLVHTSFRATRPVEGGPGVRRSDHSFAFAAAGPEAARITSDPLPLPPHIPESPVGQVHDLDGQVLLLGVGHDADTTLHLAGLLAGVPRAEALHGTSRRDIVRVALEDLTRDPLVFLHPLSAGCAKCDAARGP